MTWGDVKGWHDFRWIGRVETFSDNGVLWEPVTYVQRFVRLETMAGGIIQATIADTGTERVLAVPGLEAGWVLLDLVFAAGTYYLRVNGVESAWVGGTEDFDQNPVDLGIMGDIAGDAPLTDHAFLFFGYRPLDADPGLQEHIDDFIRLVEL